MRLPVVLIVSLAAAPLAAQDQAQPSGQAAPVIVQFDSNGRVIPSASRSCAEREATARARHDASEDARIAAGGAGPRRAFTFICEPAPATARLSPAPAVGTASGANSFGFGTSPFAAQGAETSRPVPRMERCTGNRLDQTCETSGTAALGQNGEARTRTICTENGQGRTCEITGSVTFGNSEEGRNAAREALEGMFQPDG